MEWIYKKDNSVSQGADCALIDLIDFSVSSPLKYIQRDIEVAGIAAPLQKEAYGQELVKVKVLNTGADTLDGFNLAYTINNRFPAGQYFNTKLVPYGDTVTVTFDKRADLDLNGQYKVKVYAYNNSDDYLLNDTLAVDLENTEIEESIDVFPNPFTSDLNIIVNANNNYNVRFTLTDISGKQRISVEKEMVEGRNSITLDTYQLSSGLYLLNITGGSYAKTFRLIKVRK